MKITEYQIRSLVRRILITELEGWKPNFGSSSGRGGSDWDDDSAMYSTEDPWGDEGGDSDDGDDDGDD